MAEILTTSATPSNYLTFGQLRSNISRMIERSDFWQGTADGGSPESILDQNMLYETGHWTNAEVYFVSGANAGSTVRANGSDVGVVMFPALPFAVDRGDIYEIRRFHFKRDVDDAIGAAVRNTYNIVWVPDQWTLSVPTPYPGGISLMNTPPTTSPDMLPPAYQYVYTTRAEDPRSYVLPPDVVYLNSVQYLDDSNPPVMRTLRFNHWFGRKDGNIYIDAGAWVSMNQTTIPVTINGYRYPAIPNLDTDILEIPTTFVMWHAAGTLKAQGYGSQAVDVMDDAHASATWLQMAQAQLMQSRTYIAPNSRRMVP